LEPLVLDLIERDEHFRARIRKWLAYLEEE
jgi:hypothetical protein